jgi:hypothetical protein
LIGGLNMFTGSPRLRRLNVVDSATLWNIMGTFIDQLGEMVMIRTPTEHFSARAA